MTTPSFDCATHRAADEVVICRSGRLAQLDRRLMRSTRRRGAA